MPRSLGLSPAPLSILRLLSLLLLLILSVALPEENPPQLAILAPPIGGGPTDEKGDLEVVVRMGVPVSEGGHLLGISLASYVAVFQGEGAPLIGNLTLRAAQVKIVVRGCGAHALVSLQQQCSQSQHSEDDLDLSIC